MRDLKGEVSTLRTLTENRKGRLQLGAAFFACRESPAARWGRSDPFSFLCYPEWDESESAAEGPSGRQPNAPCKLRAMCLKAAVPPAAGQSFDCALGLAPLG